ncbi:unnamed protein product [Dicrocoelium dendriticum]|nr:unnamed protein product [Dicrocoelium dendriticum]
MLFSAAFPLRIVYIQLASQSLQSIWTTFGGRFLTLGFNISFSFEESPVSPYATRSTVAACSVVSRRRSSTPTNNTSLVSELMTPVGSTPASPVPEDPASPSGQSTPIFAAASPNSTRVIPLEPVSRTKTHAVTDTENVTGLSISDPSERSRYSWSTLQWADVRVHVCYESSLWSSASCMACAESAGRCFLWPSCASRRITSGSAPKLDCDKAVPVFLQVKPEYLGVWGCEVLSPFELAEAWLGSKIRGDADIIRVRVLADTGDIIWVEYQSLQDFLGANPDLKPEINVGQLSSLFTQLSRLPVGSYVLTPSADQTTGPFDLYEADHPVSPEGVALCVGAHNVSHAFASTECLILSCRTTSS